MKAILHRKKVRTFSTSQKFVEDKKSFQLSIHDGFNHWKISHPLGKLKDWYTLLYDTNSITMSSWGVQLEHLKKSKRRTTSHLDADIAWAITSFPNNPATGWFRHQPPRWIFCFQFSLNFLGKGTLKNLPQGVCTCCIHIYNVSEISYEISVYKENHRITKSMNMVTASWSQP